MSKDKTGDTPTERNVGALNARVLILEAENKKLIIERDAAVEQLKQANDLIEADTKALLVKDASEVSEISLPELAGMDIAALENIVAISKKVRKPLHFESGGDVAAARPDAFDSRTHLHGLYLGNKGK